MSLDKAIKHGKEKRKEYRKIAQQVDPSCRCHGGCEWCLGNRLHKYRKKEKEMLDKLKDWEYNSINK